MPFSAKSFLLFISLASLAIFYYPQQTRAELATSYDWMGVFAVGTEDTDASGIPLTNNQIIARALVWKTTGNHPGNPCLASFPTSRPWLAGGCNFTLPDPMAAGAYEFRLYGNYRSTTAPIVPASGSTDNLSSFLARSKQFWIPWSSSPPALTATCAFNGDRINIDLSWPALVGINPLVSPLTDHYKIYDNSAYLDISYTNSYRDVVNPNTNHNYYVRGYNSLGYSPPSNTVSVAANSANCSGGLLPTPTPSPTPTTGPAPTSTPTPTATATPTPTPAANSPWLKTSGGDVHSNQ